MMKRTLLMILALLAVVCWLPGQANALSLESGYIATDTDVIATDGWQNSGSGFKVSWNVTEITGGYKYSYTVSGVNGDLGKGLSHIILQISDSAKAADFFNFIGTHDEPITYTAASDGNSNPNMPNPIYGFKFTPQTTTELNFTFGFDSIRGPMWGNFYAKDGVDNPKDGPKIDVTAWNSGLAGGTAFISVPDTKTVVPLPGAMLLLGAGIVRLVAYARRQKEV